MHAPHERGAFVQQRACALGFECDQRAYGRAGGRGRELRLGHVEAAQVLGGQVDPVATEVLGDVLDVFDDLQGGADGVGAADPFGGAGAGEGEHQAADRVRGQLAVAGQVGVRLVARDPLVLAVGLDQGEERLGGQVMGADDGPQGLQQRVPRRSDGAGAVEDAVQVGFEGVEHGGPVVDRGGVETEEHGVAPAGGQVAVADVVDEAGVPVDGRQPVAPGAGQEDGSDGEVLRRRLVEGGTHVDRVGRGSDAEPRGHRPPPGAGTAVMPGGRRIPVAIAVTSPVLHCRPITYYFGHAAGGFPGLPQGPSTAGNRPLLPRLRTASAYAVERRGALPGIRSATECRREMQVHD